MKNSDKYLDRLYRRASKREFRAAGAIGWNVWAEWFVGSRFWITWFRYGMNVRIHRLHFVVGYETFEGAMESLELQRRQAGLFHEWMARASSRGWDYVCTEYEKYEQMIEQRAYEMFTAGMRPRDVMKNLVISRFESRRLFREWKIEKIERL